MRNYTGGIPSYKWNLIQAILSSYDTMRKEYVRSTENILLSSPAPADMGSHRRTSDTSDTTGNKAVNLNSPFMQRLKANIIATEKALDKLNEVEMAFVRQYFFQGRRYIDCDIRVKRKGKIVILSVNTLSRVCKRIVYTVGKELGEIE